jgi:hypothetical protein
MQRFAAKLAPVGQQNHPVIGAGYVGLVTELFLTCSDLYILRPIENPKKALALFAAFPARLGGKEPEPFSGFQSDGL